MRYGYVRVSAFDSPETLELQLLQLREFGCLNDNIFIDQSSGVAGHRPALKALLEAVQPGDEIVVWTLDRIGRSVDNLARLVSDIGLKGVSLRTLGEGPENLDTSRGSNSQQHKLFDLLARFRLKIDAERSSSNRSRRRPDRSTVAGLALTWKQIQFAQETVRNRSLTIKVLCNQLKVSTPTLYSYVGPNGELRDRGRRAMNSHFLTIQENQDDSTVSERTERIEPDQRITDASDD